MPVLWTIQARRHLRQALAEKLGESAGDEDGNTPGILERTLKRLDQILAATFPKASVVVKDQVIGYRRKKDLFILMVEVFGGKGAGPYVVKIGPEEKLRKEVQGWKTCRPAGLRHDLVFLGLRKGATHNVDDNGKPWMSIVYGDAQQFLGVDDTITLDDAALECVRSGYPAIASLSFAIVGLYERIGHLLYNQAFVDDPARPDYVFDLPKLDRSMTQWETEPSCQAARKAVNSIAVGGVPKFLDPVDYLRYVQAYVPHRIVDKDGTIATRERTASEEPPAPWDLPKPGRVNLVPRLLRGCAHGDLHGRNILVGIVRGQAMWPTVFDYEDMGARNLIGWDFVKLETELKIRAYLDVFGAGDNPLFVHKIQDFEVDLDEQTESCHQNRLWPDLGTPDTPKERLAALLLTVRRMAAQHLGSNLGRPNDWLEEYYFLLACYGVFTGRFENLQPRERIGALISAGVATSRLSWPRSLP